MMARWVIPVGTTIADLKAAGGKLLSTYNGGNGPSHDGDLYGLGAIVYRVLTGKLVFPKGDVNEIIRAVLDDMPEDPRRLADMPEDVALWLRLALAKRPLDRFTNATEMADEFEAAAVGNLSSELHARAALLLGEQGWGEARNRATGR